MGLQFSGIVGGNGIRRMRSHCVQASCDFLYGYLATGKLTPDLFKLFLFRKRNEIILQFVSLSFLIDSLEYPDIVLSEINNRSESIQFVLHSRILILFQLYFNVTFHKKCQNLRFNFRTRFSSILFLLYYIFLDSDTLQNVLYSYRANSFSELIPI